MELKLENIKAVPTKILYRTMVLMQINEEIKACNKEKLEAIKTEYESRQAKLKLGKLIRGVEQEIPQIQDVEEQRCAGLFLGYLKSKADVI